MPCTAGDTSIVIDFNGDVRVVRTARQACQSAGLRLRLWEILAGTGAQRRTWRHRAGSVLVHPHLLYPRQPAAFAQGSALRHPCSPISNRSLRHLPPRVTALTLSLPGCCRRRSSRPNGDNHPGARRATPPESGGELLKTLPSSDEEGWRAERRGGCAFQLLHLCIPSCGLCHFGIECNVAVRWVLVQFAVAAVYDRRNRLQLRAGGHRPPLQQVKLHHHRFLQ